MLLERRDVLVQVEHPLHSNFNLVVGEVRERRAQQRGRELLDVEHVVRRRPQLAVDPAGLHQREDVRQDGGVHGQAGRVRRVRDHREHVLQDVGEVRLIEAGSSVFELLDVLEELEQNLQAGVGDVAHRVLERPDDAVEHELELGRGYAEEGGEAEVVDGLQEEEEVRSVFGVLFEVFVDHCERAFEHGVEYFWNLAT